MDALHHPDGTHRTTPPSTRGRVLDRHERALKRHLESHKDPAVVEWGEAVETARTLREPAVSITRKGTW